MFGRRRRPILGAAVVVGASRSAARREVQNQAERTAQAQAQQSQMQALQYEQEERAEAKRRREVEEENKRTQLAIEAALAKEKSRHEDVLPPYGTAQPAYPGTVQPSYGMAQAGREEKIYCSSCGQLNRRVDKFCCGCGRQNQNIQGEKELNDAVLQQRHSLV